MQKTIFLLAFSLLASLSFGQQAPAKKAYKHSLGISLQPLIGPLVFSNSKYVGEVQYKYQLKNARVRAGAKYGFQRIDETANQGEEIISTGRENINVEAYGGMEMLLNWKKLNFYAGAQLGLGVSTHYAYDHVQNPNFGPDTLGWGTEGNFSEQINYAGLTPVLGLEWQIIPRISLSGEVGGPLRFGFGRQSDYEVEYWRFSDFEVETIDVNLVQSRVSSFSWNDFPGYGNLCLNFRF